MAAKVLVQPGREIPNDTVVVMRPDEVIHRIPENIEPGQPYVRDGGTLVRLFLVAGVTGLLLALTEIHTTGYALGLILFYLLFLGVEIALVARSARGR